MSNPHSIFVGIAACSVLLTFFTFLIQDTENVAPMLSVLLPVLTGLAIVLAVMRKCWIRARTGGD